MRKSRERYRRATHSPRHHDCWPWRGRGRGGSGLNSNGGYPAAIAEKFSEQAHRLQAPVGFADIVEKVKPAVISVRVKVDGGAETTGLNSNEIPQACANSSAASGCLISEWAGGTSAWPWPQYDHRPRFRLLYFRRRLAVTNNHVVEKAESVQITTIMEKSTKPRLSAPTRVPILR